MIKAEKIIAVPAITIAAIVLLIIFAHVLNDIYLYKFSSQLFGHALPENTVKLEEHSRCGKLNGNGNGMDFIAVILIKSDLPIDKLKAYYSNIPFKKAIRDSIYKTEVIVLKQESENFETKYLQHRRIVFKNLKNVTQFSGYYAIFIYDGGYGQGIEGLDIRGH